MLNNKLQDKFHSYFLLRSGGVENGICHGNILVRECENVNDKTFLSINIVYCLDEFGQYLFDTGELLFSSIFVNKAFVMVFAYI